MKRWLMLVPLAVFLGMAWFLYKGLYLDPTELPSAMIDKPFPAFSLPSVEGDKTLTEADLKGKPALVNVWATWCAPCLKEIPELQAFAREQGANGTQVVGIALDDDTAVRAFLQAHAIGYPSLVDTPGPADAGVRLGNPSGVLPYSVLVAPDGRLLKTRIGPFHDAADIAAWAATN